MAGQASSTCGTTGRSATASPTTCRRSSTRSWPRSHPSNPLEWVPRFDPDVGGVLYFPPGVYFLQGVMILWFNRLHVVGAGARTTTLLFKQAGYSGERDWAPKLWFTDPCFDRRIEDVSVRDMTIRTNLLLDGGDARGTGDTVLKFFHGGPGPSLGRRDRRQPLVRDVGVGLHRRGDRPLPCPRHAHGRHPPGAGEPWGGPRLPGRPHGRRRHRRQRRPAVGCGGEAQHPSGRVVEHRLAERFEGHRGVRRRTG